MFPEAVLRACLEPHLGVEAVLLRPIRTGKFNTSYFVSAEGGEYVLRIAPPRESVFLFYERNMMAQEPELHALVREKTTVPVPRIVAYDTSHAAVDRDFLLMERLPGRPVSEQPGCDYGRVLRQVGVFLAQVHGLTAREYGYLGAHRPMPPAVTWAGAFEIMWKKLLRDIVDVGHYDAREADRLVALFDRHRDAFDRPVPASLLHMDVWAQNILVDEQDNVTGLVDWDRALWGDAEIEFAVLDYCGISERSFWEGYGHSRDLSPPARIRQIFYFLYELQKYIVIRQGRGGDAAAARRYKAQALQIVRERLCG